MAKAQNTASKVISSKKTRPGIHAKTKTSSSKNATHYKKAYKGQGR